MFSYLNSGLKMSSTNHSEILVSSLSAAKKCLSSGRFGRAFANFLLYIKLAPDKEAEVLQDFILATREWTELLERENRIEDLFKCYEQACEVVPHCETLLNNIGAQLFRLGYTDEAAVYIRRAVQVNPKDVAARENLQNLCSHLVERWHFRMLNDITRNIAYTQAITKAVKKGHRSVLDVGTGTGLLSLMAVDAGAIEIYACDQSRTMCEIATDVLLTNGADHQVQLICKSSMDIQIPQDILQRVSLIVTETFDAALFGENIIQTLKHAWLELLETNPNKSKVSPLVIPMSATLYACAIECEAIQIQNRVLFPGLPNLDFGDIEIVCTTGTQTEDPYTTENLSRIRGGFRALSDTIELIHVNFNSIQDISKLDDGLTWEKLLSITKAGRLDAIATWFDLHLIDDVTLTTSPSRKNCWEQAIFPVQFLSKSGQRQNHHVKERDCLWVEFSLNQNIISLMNYSLQTPSGSSRGETVDADVRPPDSCRSDVMDTCTQPPNTCTPKAMDTSRAPHNFSSELEIKTEAQSQNINVKEISQQNSTEDVTSVDLMNTQEMLQTRQEASNLVIRRPHSNQKKIFNLERLEISKLNNLHCNRIFVQALDKVLTELQESERHNLSVFDYCYELSPLVLQCDKCKSGTVVLREELHPLFRTLCEENGLPVVNYTLVGLCELKQYCKSHDAIVCDLLEPCGVLRQQILEDIAVLRITSLHPKGVVLPGRVTVHGMCIQSEELLAESAVIGDEITLGYKIAEFINDFQMVTHVDIDLGNLKYTKLTNPFQLLTFDLNEPLKDDEPLSYLKLDNDVKVIVTETGSLTAVVFWFQYELYDGIKISTLDSLLPWKQAAVMNKSQYVDVLAEQEVSLHVTLQNSNISVQVEGCTT